MKYYPKLGLYKASNLTYNPKTFEAYSYNHWLFTTLINGHLVFNAHRYSNTTTRHQYKIKRLLADANIEPDFIVDTRLSLDRRGWLDDAIKGLLVDIERLNDAIARPRSSRVKNAERRVEIERINGTIGKLMTTFGE